jgi:hypothetical protein
MTWQQRVEPLMKRFRELDARMTWEGYVSLNTDEPDRQDIILQHWYTCRLAGVGSAVRHRYYIVRIYADGSGWDVFAPVTDKNDVRATLEAIQ